MNTIKGIEIPEWCKKENIHLRINGLKKRSYHAFLDLDSSGMNELFYDIRRTGNLKDDALATLYIYFQQFNGVQFACNSPDRVIDYEDAIKITRDICKRFKLPFSSIPFTYHIKPRDRILEDSTDLRQSRIHLSSGER